jgi:DNA-directed RNA polymerase
MLRELPPLLVAGINKWLKESKDRPGIKHRAWGRLSQLDPRVCASLTLRVVIDSLAMVKSYTRAAIQIGQLLEDDWNFREFKSQHKLEWDRAMRASAKAEHAWKRKAVLKAMAKHGFDAHPWDEGERLAVGTVLIELTIESTGIATTTHVKRGQRTELQLEPTLEALDWLEKQNADSEGLDPMYLPFVEPPLDWEDPMVGGFHSTNVFATAIVKTTDRRVIASLGAAVMPDIYDGMNTLQATAWKVNPLMFEVFSHFWTNDIAVADLVPRDLEEIPPKPPDYETSPDSKRTWKRAARAVHDRNRFRRGERLSTARLYWVAQRYLDQQFWFAHQLDWRGRCYPVSYYLHPQGGDLVRSLLQFAEGKPLDSAGAREWHQVSGANCWGLDKASFDERLQWVEDNEKLIIDCAEDPIGCTEWTKAKTPWQFLAWCFDYYAWLQDQDHISHLPIHQDATQSGFQIYSLLLRDRASAEATNCTKSDSPRDLYARVSKDVERLLADDASNGITIGEQWLNFGIDRSLAKRPVMTRVYNATRHSCRNYVQDWVTDKAKKESKVIPTIPGGSSVWYLADKLWQSMDITTASTAVAQDWLSACARVFAEQNLPITWTSPLGLPIRQWYPNWGSKTVKTMISGQYRQLSLRTDSDKVDTRRMTQALAPNFIHSLDASAMFRTLCIAKARGLRAFACVHDSYATLAADSQALAESIRQAFVEIFSTDRLTALRQELQAQLPRRPELPPVPPFGDFDIQELRQSSYFFN